MCIDEDNIIIFGGIDKNNAQLNDLWRYNIPTNSWTKVI